MCPASQLEGVTELLGGELAGQMALALSVVWDVSLRACMCACLLCRPKAWLFAAVLTDSMPTLCRLYNLSEYSVKFRERGEYEIQRGGERE